MFFSLNTIHLDERPYYLMFPTNLKFNFHQIDYGQYYNFFLSSTRFLKDQTLLSASKTEFNRCFWLHIGAATCIHPFYLQQRFREEARKLISTMEEDDCCYEVLNSVLQRGSYVDCEAMPLLWGLLPELIDYRLTVIRFCNYRSNGLYPFQDVRTYRPRSGPHRIVEVAGKGAKSVWSGKDIILHLHFNHFTWLRPVEGGEEWKAGLPIDLLLERFKHESFKDFVVPTYITPIAADALFDLGVQDSSEPEDSIAEPSAGQDKCNIHDDLKSVVESDTQNEEDVSELGDHNSELEEIAEDEFPGYCMFSSKEQQ